MQTKGENSLKIHINGFWTTGRRYITWELLTTSRNVCATKLNGFSVFRDYPPATSLPQQQCKIYQIPVTKCSIVSRFIKWSLKRSHCQHFDVILNGALAQRRETRRWKRKQFVKYCFRRWQATHGHETGFVRDCEITSWARNIDDINRIVDNSDKFFKESIRFILN